MHAHENDAYSSDVEAATQQCTTAGGRKTASTCSLHEDSSHADGLVLSEAEPNSARLQPIGNAVSVGRRVVGGLMRFEPWLCLSQVWRARAGVWRVAMAMVMVVLP